MNNPILDGMVRLPKELLSPEEVSAIKDTLTVDGPDDDYGFGGKPKVIEFFEETETHFFVPRQWGMFRFGPKLPIVDARVKGVEVKVSFRGTWRAGQREFIDDLLRGIEQEGRGIGGIGKADPGFGKTVCSAGLIERLGRATLVIVPTKVLLKQWINRMKTYLGVKPGIVHQDACEFRGKAVVIALVHSLAARDYGDEFRNYFGLVICDEVHKGAAPTWVNAVKQFPAWWRIGLTATPRRGDGMHRAIQWQVGPIVAHGVGETLPARVEIVEWSDRIAEKHYCRRRATDKKSKPVLSLFVSELASDRIYSRWVVDKFVIRPTHPMTGTPQRQVIVLSDRVEQLVFMQRYFDDYVDRAKRERSQGLDPFVGSALCVGDGHRFAGKKLRTATEAEASGASVLFGTWQILSTGFDLDTLSVLVMATPRSDVEQAIGRIQRLRDDKPEPVVVDIRYPWARWWLYRYEDARDRLYNKKMFKVTEP